MPFLYLALYTICIWLSFRLQHCFLALEVFYYSITHGSIILTRLPTLFTVMASTINQYKLSILLKSISGCRLEYLPLYSPDYQPIKQVFSVIKSHLRHCGLSFYSANENYYKLYQSCKKITPESTWGFFQHKIHLRVCNAGPGVKKCNLDF